MAQELYTDTREYTDADFTGDFILDPDHTTVSFTGKHAMISSVHGLFDEWEAKVSIDVANPENSWVEGAVTTSSLSTRLPQRDAHLKSDDFLNVREYPNMTFVSTDFQIHGSDTVYVTGDMTIRGITKPVVFTVRITGTDTDPFGNYRLGFSARTTFNRQDFNMKFNTRLDSGSLFVGNEVSVSVDGSAIRTSATISADSGHAAV
ncbi:YceI family protein [Corynebacterium breve]|uniref:YceI family protein n=1 Tax=Corynebacterium breve TaxID=3049799 RepID=A0ABY8VFV1_9CORY|nr:YceI family protein [Corynebacterium breve]WIM68536.1 YceI family protein [Corynebacterium breve]